MAECFPGKALWTNEKAWLQPIDKPRVGQTGSCPNLDPAKESSRFPAGERKSFSPRKPSRPEFHPRFPPPKEDNVLSKSGKIGKSELSQHSKKDRSTLYSKEEGLGGLRSPGKPLFRRTKPLLRRTMRVELSKNLNFPGTCPPAFPLRPCLPLPGVMGEQELQQTRPPTAVFEINE